MGERSCVGISSYGTEGRLSVVMTQRVPRRERLALINRSDATQSHQIARGPDLRVLCCSSPGRVPPHPRSSLLMRKEHHALGHRSKAFGTPVVLCVFPVARTLNRPQGPLWSLRGYPARQPCSWGVAKTTPASSPSSTFHYAWGGTVDVTACQASKFYFFIKLSS